MLGWKLKIGWKLNNGWMENESFETYISKLIINCSSKQLHLLVESH